MLKVVSRRAVPLNATPDACVNPMTLGARIREARYSAGLTQDQLGDALMLSKQALSQWENGHSSPSRENCIAIARETGVPLAWLLTGQPLPTRTTDGKLLWTSAGGRTVAVISIQSALQGRFDEPAAQRIATVFPCSSNAFALIIADRANAGVIDADDRAVFDPSASYQPDDYVLAVVGNSGQSAIGKLQYEATGQGVITIVRPHNPSFRPLRSDIDGPISIIGKLSELTKAGTRLQ